MRTGEFANDRPRSGAGYSVQPLTAYAKARLEGLHPAYFAMVMATGVVSLACEFQGLHAVAQFLFWVNAPLYVALWAVLVARALLFPARFFGDWSSHQRSHGFFTTVAASSVLGVQMAVLGGNLPVARALWWSSVVLWTLCTYTIFVLLSIREDKPTLAEGINGGWLISVVATQSICVLGCEVAPFAYTSLDTSLLLLTSFWLCGGMLYIWTISLIFYRYLFFRFEPTDLLPPYWINMGAVAISTLAGAKLAATADSSALIAPLLPFVKGLTIMFWSTATWWIPLMVILGIWRHGVKRIPLRYDPLYWGLVFPLGMYSVCTFRLSILLDAPFLLGLSRACVIIALVAWWLTFFGLAKEVVYLCLLAGRRFPTMMRSRAAQTGSVADATETLIQDCHLSQPN